MMGAEISAPPEDQFYGDKTYHTKDLEDHHWVFARNMRDVSTEEMAEATGLKVT